MAEPRIYTPAELGDHVFYMANRDDIRRAVGEGRIREAAPDPNAAKVDAALERLRPFIAANIDTINLPEATE